MSGHKNVSLGARHPIHNYSYADAGARTAATGFVAADVGRVAYQVDTQTFWALVDDSPITWQELGAGGTGTPWGPVHTDGWEIRESFVGSQPRSHYTGAIDPAGGDAWDQASPGEDPDHIGIVDQYRTSTGAIYITNMAGQTGQIVLPLAAEGLYRVDWVFKLLQLSDAADTFFIEHGLAFDSHIDYTGNEYCTMRYTHSENSGKFRLKHANGGAAAYVDANVTVAANTWYFCRMEATQEEVRLYIDTVKNTRTLRCTINTAFPLDEIGFTAFAKLTVLTDPALVLHRFDDIHEKYEVF